MSEYGFIKLSRKIQKNWMWEQKRKFSEFERWVDLLLRAHYEKEPKKVYLSNGRSRTQTILQRGHVAASIRVLSLAWGVTQTTTQRYLKRLQEMEHIRIRKVTHKVHVIEILNYSRYNPTSEDLNLQKSYTNDSTNRYTNDSTKGHNKDKRIKERKNKIAATPILFPAEIEPELTQEQRDKNRKAIMELTKGLVRKGTNNNG